MDPLWWTFVAIAATACDAYPIAAREDSPSSDVLDSVFTRPLIGILNWLKSGIKSIWSWLSDVFASVVEAAAGTLYTVFLLVAILIAIFVVCNEFCCQCCGKWASLRRKREHERRVSVITKLAKHYEIVDESRSTEKFSSKRFSSTTKSALSRRERGKTTRKKKSTSSSSDEGVSKNVNIPKFRFFNPPSLGSDPPQSTPSSSPSDSSTNLSSEA